MEEALLGVGKRNLRQHSTFNAKELRNELRRGTPTWLFLSPGDQGFGRPRQAPASSAQELHGIANGLTKGDWKSRFTASGEVTLGRNAPRQMDRAAGAEASDQLEFAVRSKEGSPFQALAAEGTSFAMEHVMGLDQRRQHWQLPQPGPGRVLNGPRHTIALKKSNEVTHVQVKSVSLIHAGLLRGLQAREAPHMSGITKGRRARRPIGQWQTPGAAACAAWRGNMHVRNSLKMAVDKVAQGGPGPR